MIPDFRANRGFSLIELSLILMIASLLGLAAMQTYRIWVQNKISGNTEARKNLVNNALAFFVANYGRLPCPAVPGQTANDLTAGHENCLTVGGPLGQCNNGLCRIVGGRDTPADTETTTFDRVLVGVIPYASLNLSVNDGVDGWGNKMTYAVSEYLTDSLTYNANWGVLNVKQANRDAGTGALTGVFNIAGRTNTFPYVVLSHGPDGKGAWNYQGSQPTPCGIGLSGNNPDPNGTIDSENCDGDKDFVNASTTTGVYTRAPGPEFFDDAFTLFELKTDNDKWSYYAVTGMRNKSGGRVGIGVSAPQAMLDVAGNILLEDARANEFCSEADTSTSKPSYCFQAIMIAGTGGTSARCGNPDSVPPQPMMMKGVDGASANKLDCAEALSTASVTPASCPAGQYMKGIDASGGIVCEAP